MASFLRSGVDAVRRQATRVALVGARVNGVGAARALSVDTVPVFVNGVETHVPKGVTVLQACEQAGVDVPRFCYHQRLSIAGNCRMCLVEVEKSPKPVASCAMPVMPNMNIKTTTPLVKKAREGVMEFLLINHPLDCPICDQGGECELQDQSMIFGSDRSRFTEFKRAVEDKELGPLVKTVMTRCIHCTRCVRFATEVAGVQDLGITGRGNQAEVGTYVSKLLSSELSGNVIDLCPVGALTSKPFAFTARPWELRYTESIDVTDGLGSNIRVDTRGTEVMRVVPRLHEGVNEEWISDKARFSYDGLKRQRLDKPMMKDANGKLKPATWEQALDRVAAAIAATAPGEMKAVAGKLADAESVVALKDLFNRLGAGNTVAEGVEGCSADARSSYLFNSNIVGVEDADLVLLVGSDPRSEAPVLNARLRRANIAGGTHVASVGPHQDLTYPVQSIGLSAKTIEELVSGKHPFVEKMKEAKRPLIIVGASLLRRPDSAGLLKGLHALADATGVVTADWNGFNVLHDAGGTVAALDLGFVPSTSAADVKPEDVKLVYSLAAEDFDAPAGAFVVYQGHHGDAGATKADVILPGAAYTEKYGTYVNTEGRAQRAMPAVAPYGSAMEDWKIVRALSEVCGSNLPYDTLKGVRERMASIAPHFAKPDEVEPALWLNGATYAHITAKSAKVDDSVPLGSSVKNFYMTDAIGRASATMAKCTKAKASGMP
mmetsp:Transcript_41727/g.102782  ORF Transcript_41727/g.102782 Transcript_41727/m.102782 type:complete len:718 (-) Transcript_41727:199-2352(-)|eukprot:CAMPEP_0197577868 /NCGR_PEP_ID=MMETSP1326-20131121/2328_1 /TAXON_ID=1155430 /ORGANISM="Genus nov. species nov., Strain RCC2288" /LENGTH=717 /DNA_ID=CAMNT_0043140989 /DNA_START=78 /DNA_END=2231 /DNA_ORIENTATION=-